MDNINLCMIAPEFFPVWGGTGSYIIELIKYLPQNVNVNVVTLKRNISKTRNSEPKSKIINSVIDRPLKVDYISESKETFFYNLFFQLGCLKNVPKLHKEQKFDIINSHLSHMPDVFLQLLKPLRVPTVVTVHSTIQQQKETALKACSRFSDLEWSEKNTVLFYPLINSLQRKYVKRISHFIAVSHITKEHLQKHLDVEENKISVVYNGVDTELFHPPTKIELEKKFSGPSVVYMGRLMAQKGLDVLIKAIPEILRSFPETHFLFVGEGNRSLYKSIIKSMGVPETNFSFIGPVGYFGRMKILREATVFVNPSLFENCSLSILEAMSCKTAVVASNVGGNPEIIKSGKNGVLVPPSDSKMLANSIRLLLKDETLNKKIGNEARRTVETSFSSKKCASETYKVYSQFF